VIAKYFLAVLSLSYPSVIQEVKYFTCVCKVVGILFES